MKFRIGSCSLAATWFETWAARTATANWAGSMNLPLKTASATRKAVLSWKELWSERAKDLRSTFHLTIPEEAWIFRQVLFIWNLKVIKSTKKNLLTYTVTLASESDSWTTEWERLWEYFRWNLPFFVPLYFTFPPAAVCRKIVLQLL